MRLFDFVLDSYKYVFDDRSKFYVLAELIRVCIILEFVILFFCFILWEAPMIVIVRIMMFLLVPTLSPLFIFYFKIKKEMQ